MLSKKIIAIAISVAGTAVAAAPAQATTYGTTISPINGGEVSGDVVTYYGHLTSGTAKCLGGRKVSFVHTATGGAKTTLDSVKSSANGAFAGRVDISNLSAGSLDAVVSKRKFGNNGKHTCAAATQQILGDG